MSNPANEEYEVVRTTLLPGLLKTLKHNKSMPVKDGIKFYEISDVVLQDTNADVGARNERHLAATYAGLTDGFEVIHGLVDRYASDHFASVTFERQICTTLRAARLRFSDHPKRQNF